MTKSFLRFLTSVMVLTTIAACGGGGGGGGGFTPPPPPPTGWQPGVFLAASTFQNMCAAPRVGADPTNGNQPYPDMQGTILDENNFLRSYTNDTYLWYDQIVDRDPALTNNPLDYFDLLVNIANDRFSFSADTQERFDLVQGGVSAGYGAEWAIISATVPREIIVAYTEPNTPATNHVPPLLRGTTILSIDGVDINTNTQAGVDALNEGLRPSALGVPHTFEVQDIGEAGSHTVTMTTATITNAMVQNTKVFDTPTGKVGYLTFNFHRAPAETELFDAINQLIADAAPDDVADLILDIR